jgi:hypothetical protein
MSAKKSFREVTLEGEIAQLKGRAEDAAIWRVRLGEVERWLQDAEYQEQKHVGFFCSTFLTVSGEVVLKGFLAVFEKMKP